MYNEFTALIEPDREWSAAYCPEVSEANGQGRTSGESKQGLAAAVALVLEDRRADALSQANVGSVERNDHGGNVECLDLLRLQRHNCVLKREGGNRSIW